MSILNVAFTITGTMAWSLEPGGKISYVYLNYMFSLAVENKLFSIMWHEIWFSVNIESLFMYHFTIRYPYQSFPTAQLWAKWSSRPHGAIAWIVFILSRATKFLTAYNLVRIKINKNLSKIHLLLTLLTPSGGTWVSSGMCISSSRTNDLLGPPWMYPKHD